MPHRKADPRTLSVGQKIKKTRTAKKMTHAMLANQTGYAVNFLKNIESGEEIPPVGILLQISKALDIDSGILLKEQASNLNQRIKAYTTRTQNYAYTTLTPGAENKHLKAFLVSVDPMTDHKGVGYQHQGEEFVYVLEGQIEITVGDHANQLESGDSLHFNSGIRHKMRNPGRTTTKLIVVVYNP